MNNIWRNSGVFNSSVKEKNLSER